MGEVVSLSEFKKDKGIAPNNSIYSTLNATDEQVEQSKATAKRVMANMYSLYQRMPYAVVYGYKGKDDKVRLLKSTRIYPTEDMFKRDALKKTLDVLCIIAVYK